MAKRTINSDEASSKLVLVKGGKQKPEILPYDNDFKLNMQHSQMFIAI